jgi:ketosteroid isomerase-like protein
MKDLQQRVDDLSRRVQALEDELAIHRLIVRYGLAVDIGDAQGASEVFSEDTVYDTDVGVMQGRTGVRDMVRGPRHQAMVGNCAHQIGPALVEVDGDRAVATGYSRVYLRKDDGIQIYRVSFNRWELQRRGSRWQIVHRITRLLGHAEARQLFQAGFD